MKEQDIEKFLTDETDKGKCPICASYIEDILINGPHPSTNVRHCKNCGQQVWTKCDCGRNLRYDDRVCQQCGRDNSIFLGDNNNISSWIAREISKK